MAVFLRRPGVVESVPRGSVAVGTLVGFTGVTVASIGDPPMGIVLDDIATDSPPTQLRVYGKGAIFEDDSVSFTQGDKIFSDGDGTYSAVEPAGAAGTLVWILGIARTPTQVEITLDAYEKGA